MAERYAGSKMYSVKEVEHDYDSGLGLDYIARCWRASKMSDGERISQKRAEKEICEIIYNHIPKRKERQQNG